MSDADRISELEREIAALKAAHSPRSAAADEQAARKWQSDMHQLSEARASRLPPALVREIVGGVSDADARDLVRASHAPTGPSGQGVIPSSQDITRVSSNAGIPRSNISGWAYVPPLRPPPGVERADRIVDEFDRRDREELARKLGKQ